MDMGGMGMDMGMNMFQTTNMALARDFWYIVAGVVGAMLVVRLVNSFEARRRLRKCASSAVAFPTKPNNRFLESWATLTAIVREASYPQLYVPFRWFTWLTPPPMGRVLVLLAYWAVVIYMMAWDSVVFDAYFWERIGFRNAWVTVTQIPFLYLLASKCSIFGLLSRSSYERFNWLHRWVARTIFVTASVHGWHFYKEWALADFVELEIKAMPMVKWGIGAWGILLWQLVVSLWPFRRLSYEIFVAQHVISAILFLWVVYVHVPSYAQYNVWFAIAALCFDRACRTVMLVWQNIKVFPNKAKCMGGQRIGHQIDLRAVGESTTVVTVRDVHFKWRAGQHVYLNIPRIGPIETHPYTVACAHKVSDVCICNSIQLVVRKHGGFSQRIHKFAAKAEAAAKPTTLTGFVTGPYGVPPRFDVYETLILISASTGASFTLPILESVLQTSKVNCTRRIHFLLTAKQNEEIEYYLHRLHEFMDQARDVGMELHVHVAVTGCVKRASAASTMSDVRIMEVVASPTSSTSGSAIAKVHAGEKSTGVDVEKSSVRMPSRRGSGHAASEAASIHHAEVRPDVESFIRGPVEATGGETSVVVCGGASLVARVRNCVAGLSDERAVHKGTGAQGIHLHVEEYCF